MLVLDNKGEEKELSEEEVEELHSLSSQLFSLTKFHITVCSGKHID